MEVHPLHIVVLILGVLASLRHMDVAQRTAEHHPGVDTEAFRAWKRLASGAYRLAQGACFGKVLLDILVSLAMRPFLPADPHTRPTDAVRWTVGAIGVSLDVGWVVLMIVSYVRIRKAHQLAAALGVERRAPVQPD